MSKIKTRKFTTRPNSKSRKNQNYFGGNPKQRKYVSEENSVSSYEKGSESEGERYEDDKKLCYDLHKAARRNDSNRFQRLLEEYQANENCLDMNGNTPLHIAAIKSFEICEILLNSEFTYLNLPNKDGITAIECAISPDGGDTRILELLIEHGAEVNYENENGISLLQQAASNGHYEQCKLLIEYGAKMCDPKYGATKQIKMLLQIYNPKIYDVKNKKELNEKLFHVAEKNDVRMLLKLIKLGASVNSVDKNNNTLLHYASENIDACRVLLTNNASVNKQNNFGQTPLHITENPEICKLLISSGEKVNVNIKDITGVTPLHYAAIRGNYNKCVILMENGAESINYMFGRTLEIQKLLITHPLHPTVSIESFPQNRIYHP